MSAAPWSIAEPGGDLRADGFNALQVGFCEALAAHDHAGRGGAPLRGPDFDPESALRVRSLSVRTLRVEGMDIDERLNATIRAFVASHAGELADLLDATGGSVDSLRAGDIAAARLTVSGAVEGETLCEYRGGLLLMRTQPVAASSPDASGRALVGLLRVSLAVPAIALISLERAGDVLRASGGDAAPDEELKVYGGSATIRVQPGTLRIEVWGRPDPVQSYVVIHPISEGV